MIIKYNSVRWKNLLSTGNAFNEVKLDSHPVTVITGKSGGGKCLAKETKLVVRGVDEETHKKFLEFMKRRNDKKI